jgi:hypothetical protein
MERWEVILKFFEVDAERYASEVSLAMSEVFGAALDIVTHFRF